MKTHSLIVGKKLKNKYICNLCNNTSNSCREVRNLALSSLEVKKSFIIYIVCQNCIKKLEEDAVQILSMTKESIEKTYGVEL